MKNISNTAPRAALMLMILATSAPSPSEAADAGSAFLRGGPAYANFDASARVTVGGVEATGADAAVSTNTGAEFEVGYFLSPQWSVSLAVGVPPKARFFGGGTLASAGKLGAATYGPSVLAILYSPLTDDKLHPYIGVGASYVFIFQTEDGGLKNLRVNRNFGEALQFGAEYAISSRVSMYFDVKKIWLKTDASGLVVTASGYEAATARVQLDPVILSTGLSVHF